MWCLMSPKLRKSIGYFFLPHELLHVAGYRLVGKNCRYHPGDWSVKPEPGLTRKQRLVGLLFPVVICTLAGAQFLFVGMLAIRLYLGAIVPLWVLLAGLPCTLLGVWALLNATASGSDLIHAYYLIRNKPLPDQLPILDWLPRKEDEKYIWVLIVLTLIALILTWPR